MATTSYLYHALGLLRYCHLRTEYEAGAIYHHVMRKNEARHCAACGARWHELTLQGRFQRSFRALPVGRRAQFVVLHGHFQYCKRCARTLREPIDFARGKLRRLQAAAAGIDVFCAEPPPKGHPFFGLENVILTPHVAGVTAESKARIFSLTVANLVKALKGAAADCRVA